MQVLQELDLGRDALQGVVGDRLHADTKHSDVRKQSAAVRRDHRRRRGAAVRARHLPSDLALPAKTAPRREPIRESVQHHQAVQVELLQASRPVPEHGGEKLQFRRLHRSVHGEHLRYGHHVRLVDS